MVEIYIARTDALKDPSVYQRLYEVASPERRERADAYVQARNRRLCIASDALLRYALAEHGVAGGEMRVGEHGKPYLAGLPLRFNLSHAGEMVLCAVSDQEIGCDVEYIPGLAAVNGNASNAQESLGTAPAGAEAIHVMDSQNPADAASCLQIAKMFFHPEEYQQLLAAADDTARLVLFYRLWTCKESYLKCLGVGMEHALSGFCVRFDGDVISVAEDGMMRPYHLHADRVGADYCYAVCGTDADPVGEPHRIEL